MLDKGLGILSTVHRPNVLIKATIKASTRAILHRCYRNDNPKDELSETPLPLTKDTFHHSRLAEIQPPVSVNFLSSISLFYAFELVRSVLIVKNQCNWQWNANYYYCRLSYSSISAVRKKFFQKYHWQN